MRPPICATCASPATAPTAASRGINVPVKLKLIDEAKFSHEGKMDFVDNAIDRASGTIRGRAEFANPDGTLTPGMFGRIQVPAGPPSEAMLVPDVAIGTEQVRKFVLVVDGENVARAEIRDAGSGRRGSARGHGRARSRTTASSSTA